MDKEQMEFKALKIAGAFVEGNTRRTWAVNEVTQAPSKKVATWLAAKVMGLLTPDQREEFLRALYNRMVS